MKALYQKIADLLVHDRNAVAPTGAGISAERGIPTFRDKGGLWDKYGPMVYVSIEMFRQDTSKSCTSKLSLLNSPKRPLN